MNGALFDWDDANILHVARHDVTPEEAEGVILGNPQEVDCEEVEAEPRWSYVGETWMGRILYVVVTMRRNQLRVVTAFEPTKRIKTAYLKARVDSR